MCQVHIMIGWRLVETNQLVFYQDEETPIGIVTRLEAGNWGFEYVANDGRIIQLAFDGSLPVNDIKRLADQIISNQIRNNETIH